MDTTTTTTIPSVPKNQTGIYAGNSLQENKPIRKQTNGISIPSFQHRSGASVNILTEQNRLIKNAFHTYYPHVHNHGIRNGFRPSNIHRQKLRASTARTRHENHSQESRENPSKDLLSTTPTSARLQSEINQLNSQLKVYGDLNKILRLQSERDTLAASQSALSYSTSNRISSASTNHTGNRLHQRFPSTLNNTTVDASDKSMITSSSPVNDTEVATDEIDCRLTHAFQIPQQCNVGSASIFPLNPSSSINSNTHSMKSNRLSDGNKPASCPFYVMYFANLSIQNRSNGTNSRIQSANSTTTRYSSARRQLSSPISVNTYSTIDDDNELNNSSTTYYHKKRFSAKFAAFESENSHLLKDVLRTTSWNHLQI